MDKTEYEKAWNAAIDFAIESFDDITYSEGYAGFDEWYERNVIDPPNAEADLTSESF